MENSYSSFLSQPFLAHWFLQTIAMVITAALIPRLTITNIIGAFLIVLALSFINATVWDAALFFQIPNTITSQAFTLIVVNGLIFYVVTKILPGIEVDGLLPALAAPLVFSVVNILITNYAKDIDWIQLAENILIEIRNLRDSLVRAH